MKKVTSYWISHQLTHEQRANLCRENLAKFQNGSCRSCNMITGDETCIYHRQTRHKLKNASCLGEDESPTTVVRGSKKFLSIFLKSNGLVLIHCVGEGKTRDHNYYIENLLSRKYGNKEG